MKWTSGTELSGAIDVQGGDLLTVRLGYTTGTERPIAGRSPSWRYSPKRGTQVVNDRPRLVVGSDRRDELFYEHDLIPMWLPYPGTVWLKHGNGVTYTVAVYRTACYPPPPAPGWVLTLREVDTTPVALPFGTETIEVSEDATLTIAAAGESVSLRATAAQVIPVSNWAAVGGTVAQGGGTALQTVICRGRW